MSIENWIESIQVIKCLTEEQYSVFCAMLAFDYDNAGYHPSKRKIRSYYLKKCIALGMDPRIVRRFHDGQTKRTQLLLKARLEKKYKAMN